MVQDITSLFGRKCRIDGYEDSADLCGSENNDQKLRTVGEQKSDLVTFFDTGAEEGVGGAMDLARKSAVAERALTHQKRALCALPSPLAQKLL